mmetsp:Transcript_29755/g.96960  ORF Transcript_29755/g.96960 Transcript_29755/m.96960 type:complete len:258 (-) Transcript_29755:77-850(-)
MRSLDSWRRRSRTSSAATESANAGGSSLSSPSHERSQILRGPPHMRLKVLAARQHSFSWNVVGDDSPILRFVCTDDVFQCLKCVPPHPLILVPESIGDGLHVTFRPRKPLQGPERRAPHPSIQIFQHPHHRFGGLLPGSLPQCLERLHSCAPEPRVLAPEYLKDRPRCRGCAWPEGLDHFQGVLPHSLVPIREQQCHGTSMHCSISPRVVQPSKCCLAVVHVRVYQPMRECCRNLGLCLGICCHAPVSDFHQSIQRG